MCRAVARDVCCGGGPDGFLSNMKIVDPESRREVATGETGEIWIASGSVAQGYWGKPELSESTFRATLAIDDGHRYLRTGDLAYTDAEGRLYICARLKDLIILQGKNYYSDDLEAAAQSRQSGRSPSWLLGCLRLLRF